ncbi:MAG TPA: Abi-alpha family protein [Solimonas sp.]|nr:Abi-alpha family protein [Solimonas sp.]
MATRNRGEESGLSRLISGAGRVMERLPGGSVALRGARYAEQTALQLLRARLQRVAEEPPVQVQDGEPADAAATRSDLAARLSDLLERARDQNRPQAREEYFRFVLGQLLPDEARMLAALAHGSVHALIHVGAGPALGGVTHRVLENRSSLPKAAGVAWPDLGPRYVAHLREFELVETGKEEPALKTKYEILEADTLVRTTLERISKDGGLRPRVLRRTLKLSDIGRQFWQACQPAGVEGG